MFSNQLRSGTPLFIALLAGSLFSIAVQAEEPAPAPPVYEFREKHDPNGIGKFYLDREIAHVMGHQGIGWLERNSREEEERLSLLVKLLDLKPGMVVADIGAGSGVIATLMAPKLKPEGEVLAVDIQQEMLDALAVKCKLMEIDNVVPVLGTTKSPRLEPGTVDLVIMVDVYHEFDFPYEMLREISNGLKVGGRVAFVEYRKEDPRVPIKEVHKMSQKQVKLEASQPGLNLEWVETKDELPRQHVVIFKRVATGESKPQEE
ncbi:MAG: methyltransferase domain-containing protein [Planctomycetaceae bacterium]